MEQLVAERDGERAVHVARRHRAARRSAAAEQAPGRDAGGGGRVRFDRRQPRRHLRRGRDAAGGRRADAREPDERAGRAVRRGRAGPRRDPAAEEREVDAGASGSRRRRRRSASSSPHIRSTATGIWRGGQGARPIATLGEVPVAEGARSGATIAALVEDARWRTSARGNALSDDDAVRPVGPGARRPASTRRRRRSWRTPRARAAAGC